MKHLLLICAIMIMASPVWAQTQAQMTKQACDAYSDADMDLNDAYTALKNTCKSNPGFLQRLKAAQQTWVKLRDQDTDLLHPLTADGGSIVPMERCAARTEITQKRADELKRWNNSAVIMSLCDDTVE